MTGTALRNSKSWNDRMEYWAEQAASSNNTSNSNATVEALLQDMIGLLQQVQTQTDGIELTSDNISLNADAINLNTDQVEALLQSLFVALTNTNITLDGNVTQLLAQIRNFTQSVDGQMYATNASIDDLEGLLAGIDAKLVQLLVKPELQLVETHLVLTGVEQSLAAANTEAQGVLLKGVKADGSPNASFVQLGSTPGALRFRIYSEDEKAIDPPSGGFIDLSQLLVKGQAGDGIAVWTMNYGTPNA